MEMIGVVIGIVFAAGLVLGGAVGCGVCALLVASQWAEEEGKVNYYPPLITSLVGPSYENESEKEGDQ